MGNKNTSPPSRGAESGVARTREVACRDAVAGPPPREGALGPSPQLLASLQSLAEENDYTLLPQSLHQMAEAYSLQEDYRWAIQFLQLEKFYHERLLSNLAALQERWENQLKDRKGAEILLQTESNSSCGNYIETLNHICRNHHRPSLSVEKQSGAGAGQSDALCRDQQCGENRPSSSLHGKAAQGVGGASNPEPEIGSLHTSQWEAGDGEEGEEEEEKEGGEEERGEEEEEEVYEEGQEVDGEVCEETAEEEEEVKGEWPAGVRQASDKDLVKLCHVEGTSAPEGLVSILKRRRASLDGLPPPGVSVGKQSSKRKVRFTEPEDAVEQDEVGGESCLILLLLCLVTVVISIGGTALYCTLVDTYSNICTDFSDNVNFYVLSIRKVFDQLRNWLPIWT